jgi:hypothetical protein
MLNPSGFCGTSSVSKSDFAFTVAASRSSATTEIRSNVACTSSLGLMRKNSMVKFISCWARPRWLVATSGSRGWNERRRVRVYGIFALRATTDLGEAIASARGPPLTAHEERQFEDGEHKTRPLEVCFHRGRPFYFSTFSAADPGGTNRSIRSCIATLQVLVTLLGVI